MLYKYDVNKLYFAKILIRVEDACSVKNKPKIHEEYSVIYKNGEEYIDLFSNSIYPNSFYVPMKCGTSEFRQYTIEYIAPFTDYYHGNKKSLTNKQAITWAKKYIPAFVQKTILSILLDYDSVFLEDKNIEVYKFSNVAKLTNMYPKRKAYTLVNINGMNILMEVTKVDIQNRGMDFYILSEDIPKSEKEACSDDLLKLKCDYIYSYRNAQVADEINNQRVKRAYKHLDQATI